MPVKKTKAKTTVAGTLAPVGKLRRKKWLSMLLSSVLCSALLFLPNAQVSAHEFGETVGLPDWYRWGDVRTSSSGIRYCHMMANGDNLANGLKELFSDTITHWNYNSDNKVKIQKTNFTNSNLDLMVVSESLWDRGENVGGVTYLRNANGLWNQSRLSYGGNTGFTSGYIDYALIYFNPSDHYYSAGTNAKRYVLRHEIGHAVGLGHCPNNVNSLMCHGMPYNYIHVWALTDHDRADLNSFYPN